MAEMASKKDDETISHKIEQLSNRKLMWANHTPDSAGQTLSMTAALYDMPLSLDVLLHRIGPEALKER
ncbi:hypothetical protein Pmar_PMAR023646 [Perkinsus marinus ATCC 50983]|uniref:Uncharacterized protein n=1 Tax=Perkinsus marinus (strain ATCC 50983 / TXsc) TaxID=423536 RepID=C5KCX1_PERM5|nr:hypothetical protein Pmar_PMAR023646 [Perkinsus marinus ATCC 50983]EER17720.1 hypothetical protein Pmar_PMAR023646 [Perkinsus marinus ATCC 50983]|eukprot:XP_002785924.1 hypothetical protein Pmar_PMAR023646 [Perkinsus marinus ATCC 50983]